MSSLPSLAVVTGAGSGIGYALTQALLARGVEVVAVDRDTSRLDDRVQAHRFDVRDGAAMRELAESLAARPVNHLFANAGVGVAGDVLSAPEQAWQWAWDVNVVSVLRTLRLWWPHLVSGRGKAVVTVSAAALQSYPGAGPYRATKAALLSALEGLYYQAQGSGVGVHALCPGLVRTDITAVHRYAEATQAAPAGPNPFETFMRTAVREAEPADAFARRVLDGLDRGAPFYWFTHPETMAWTEGRHHCAVHAGTPFADFGAPA
ncbi:SDR family NAD(P)-dependent oxidoreductase [Actinoplanes teichomyceticus]|uniref:NADP-dependent 3-hydroxy acid dehydrogenase YdfG n=1 Tax=Actinoplanes teichomyceticus TaxID=1867 RepID=A0A561VII1_ACTTI|nr:SDR family oxidoreductase [Actinoplanes teichomyceticus]TWG11428.1 NADP-dependent 3-hydroxy acid dehydrogenase YdfG [Actinoplanes teichomyceticus]GIF15758.1 oxidoreductase [Actinoplanes teichomyceticus]